MNVILPIKNVVPCGAVALLVMIWVLGCSVEVNSDDEDTTTDSASDSSSDTGGTDSLTTDSETGPDSGTATDSTSDSATELIIDTDSDSDSIAGGCTAAAIAGNCSKDNLLFCADANVAHLDCASVGESCKVDGGVANCTKVARNTACGELTPLGECVDDRIRWCDESKIMAMPTGYECGLYGQICNPTGGADGGAMCVSHGDCGAIDEAGACEGKTLRYCSGGELFVFDCGVDECRTVAGLADCFTAGAGLDCGTETEAGRCEGDEVVRCLGGTVAREKCDVLGMQCVNAGGASCQPLDTCAPGCAVGYSCVDGRCNGPADAAREWTIAVYMVGDNNLSNAVWQDLNEMESAVLPDTVSVVTEFELSQQYTSFAPEQYRSGAYRLAIAPDTDIENVTSLAGATALGEVDMTDPAHVAQFAKWAAETYPSKKFAFLFWDHGFGWRGGFIDSRSDGVMSLLDIVTGLRDSGTNPDLVGFDACMMGMQEVAMALRGITSTLVASEEAVPGGGYPYDTVLTDLGTDATMDAVSLGQVIATDYTSQFDSGLRARSVTMSVLDLTKADLSNDALAEFSKAFIEDLPGKHSLVREAIRSPQILRYREKDSADLISTMNVFEMLDGGMAAGAAAYKSWFAGSGFVVDSKATLKLAESSGVAIHLPANAFSLYTTSSLDTYRENTSFLPLAPWIEVLANLTESASGETGEGIDGFTVELEWTNAADNGVSNVDLDLVVVEPSGAEAAAADGAVTSNGLLSADSADSGINRESYELRTPHQPGNYVIVVQMYVGDKATGLAEQATPKVTIRMGSETAVRLRGYTENREVVQVPMNATAPLNGTIDSENVQQVLNFDYSTLWYVATLQVK